MYIAKMLRLYTFSPISSIFKAPKNWLNQQESVIPAYNNDGAPLGNHLTTLKPNVMSFHTFFSLPVFDAKWAFGQVFQIMYSYLSFGENAKSSLSLIGSMKGTTWIGKYWCLTV
jgi:hypothetical protein